MNKLFQKYKLIVITLLFILISQLFNSCGIVEIKGKVIDTNKNPLAVNVIWQNLASGDTIDNMQNDPITGDYKYLLPQKIHYGYTFTKVGYFPVFRNIDLSDNNEFYTNEEDIVLIMLSVKELIAKGSFTVENVFFDNNSRIMKQGSQYSLKILANFLNENNISKIEVHGYTDSKGDDTYNIGLSTGRAESVCDYLRGNGCPKITFIPKGFGKANPIASNDTEQGKSKNRRVEIKIIK